MIGTSARRRQYLEDPLLARLARAHGLDDIPQRVVVSEATRRERERIAQLALLRDGRVAASRTEVPNPEEMALHVKDRAREYGAPLVGIALLRPVMIDLNTRLSHERIIALGVPEHYAVVLDGADAIKDDANRAYRVCAEVATSMAQHIREDLGWPARAHHNGGTDIQAIPALYYAGLGELGKHGSLINPEYGASFRPSFVTTDLPMAVDAPLIFGAQDRCLNCNVCDNNCPGDAIPNEYIITEGVRRWVTDIEKCYPFSQLKDAYCHICVDVCPFNAAIDKVTYKSFMRERRKIGYKSPARRGAQEGGDQS